jgi:hypothetical protein
MRYNKSLFDASFVQEGGNSQNVLRKTYAQVKKTAKTHHKFAQIFTTRVQCYETFFVRNLLIFVLS